ncbi:MFS transporter [Agrobacterium tumefaciens]|uniref:MFS transporter n=1 Tax=Agrobacterium tumefaciens TaxID=358 RepID=UPI001EEDBE88
MAKFLSNWLSRSVKAVCSPVTRIVTALSVTQLIGWGTTFWLPAVTGPAMARELDIPLSMAMAGPTVMLVVMAFMSWPLSIILERYGARPPMAVGSVFGSTGLLAIGLAQGPFSYFLSWTILGLAGSGMLTTPAQIAVAEAADKTTARKALGVLILAGGLTSSIMWPLTGLLQAAWGWRTTSLVYAGLMVVICAPLHWLVLPSSRGRNSATKSTNAPAHIDRWSFALLAITFAANGFFTWGFALTIIILFEAGGLDHASALMAAVFIGVAQWAGRLVDFLGGRHWSGFVTGLIAAALFPLSFIVLLLTSSLGGAMAFATLYGLASGITAVTRATLPLEIFPSDTYARASAQLSVPLNLAFAAAPPVFAAVMTSAGPHAALWLAFAISVVAFCTLLSLSARFHGRGRVSR